MCDLLIFCDKVGPVVPYSISSNVIVYDRTSTLRGPQGTRSRRRSLAGPQRIVRYSCDLSSAEGIPRWTCVLYDFLSLSGGSRTGSKVPVVCYHYVRTECVLNIPVPVQPDVCTVTAGTR